MKTIKLFCLLLAVCSFTFSSCSDSSPIENDTPSAQKSVALRTIIFELQKANPPGNRPANNVTQAKELTPVSPFCFEFVYPLVLSYNNGTAVTVASSEGLWQLINAELPNLFLDGIVFPFQINQNGNFQTINSESEFVTLINSCGFNNLYEEIFFSYCFDFVFPITLGYNGQTIEINSQQELDIFGNAPGFIGQIQIVFPVSVIFGNEIVVVNSIYEFYQMAANCNTCICTLEYAPVCVQTANGIVEYSNACFAQCAGFTQNDFIVCNPTTACSITNLTTTVGPCNPDGSYALTIDFDYENTSATTFQVHNSSNQLVGTFQLSALPITIPSYISSDAAIPSDNLDVSISDTCMATQQWTKPVCIVDCNCTTDVNPVCVMANGQIVTYGNACLAQCDGYSPNQFVNCNPNPTFNFMELLGTCFNIMYPVTVQYQGALVTVTSNSQLVQYYNPATQTMPIMNYPIAVTWGLQTATFTYANQIAFETAIINANCP
jgi:hypothetical protein